MGDVVGKVMRKCLPHGKVKRRHSTADARTNKKVELEDITLDNRGVRVKVTAHYEARVKQRTPGTDDVWWLFPVFERGDTMGRVITAVVRTTNEPNTLYGFEDLTVEGFVRPPGRLVPREAREGIIGTSSYVFDEGYVLIEEFTD